MCPDWLSGHTQAAVE